MSVDKFKFVSPGVFINEIDRSVITGEGTDPTGPVIIGRSVTGPAMYPTKVETFQDFINLFGNPNPGQTTQDPWREGNHQATTYAAYAAEAYLRGGVGPVTFIRTLGLESPTANATGKAGWDTTKSPSATPTDNGGAYGLFVVPSGSDASILQGANTLLSAIIYVDSGSVTLSGSAVSGAVADEIPTSSAELLLSTGTAGFFQSVTGTPHDFTLMISGTTGITKKIFSLDDSRPNFIRSVLNTNAVNVNDGLVDSDNLREGEQYYWLGESFENAAVEHMSGTGGNNFACLLPLESASVGREDMRHEMTYGSTGWFFSQDLNTDTASYAPANMTKLFKLHSVSGGEWTQSNVKISIEDMRYPRTSGEFASFTVVVRDISDRDLKQSRLEVYSNCNLNPASPNYITKKIGDTQRQWNVSTQRFEEFGEYANKSNYIRVEIHPNLEGLLKPEMLPFGFEAAPYLTSTTATTGSVVVSTLLKGAAGSASPLVDGSTSGGLRLGLTDLALTMSYPAIPFRDSVANSDAGKNSEAYFGVATYKDFGSLQKDTLDYLRAYPSSITTNNKLTQQLFSLDNLSASFDSDDDITGYVTYVSASRTDGDSISATKGWKEVIDEQLGNITTVLHGGFDGLNIKEIDHFANKNIDGTTSEDSSSALYTIQQTIEMVKDTTFLEMNAAAIPGITDTTLNNRLVNACEERADSLAVVDLPGVYYPRSEGVEYTAASDRFGTTTPTEAANTFEARALNSSYACTYYPWVNMKDTNYDQNFWSPPSVAALGTFASSENKSEIWFAPAGFNRGGLSEAPYAAGLPVSNVSKKLTSKERDSLYEVSINPIASFPSEGIVIFGQKTTQTQQSALDRINVRRMINFIKREISKIASGILFDPNVQVTWERFLGETEPFLASIQSRLGLTGYKVVLDDTTTTPDLVDRNILYAKIFLKPARAIEFIAIDFIITRSGASFDD